MDGYKSRIDKAIGVLENALEVLLSEKAQLATKIELLNRENEKLKGLTKSATLKLDEYIKELEDIRRNHGNSNTSN